MTERSADPRKSRYAEIKLPKASRYVSEPSRFTVTGIDVVVKSEHGVRCVTLREPGWDCTCEFFAERGTCSHILALDNLLFDRLGLRRPGTTKKEE